MKKPESIPNPKTTFSLIFIKAFFFSLGFAFAIFLIIVFFFPSWGQHCYNEGYEDGKTEAAYGVKIR